MNIDFENKFRHIIKKMSEVGTSYAEAKGQSWQMQELRTSVLALMMQKLHDIPVSKAEMTAKASSEYVQHLEETSKAIKQELKLKSDYEMWKASFEALRSLSSLEKKTMDIIGG